MNSVNKNSEIDSEIVFSVEDVLSQVSNAQAERSNGFQGRNARDVLADMVFTL